MMLTKRIQLLSCQFVIAFLLIFPLAEVKAQKSVTNDLLDNFINTLEKTNPEKVDLIQQLSDAFIHQSLQFENEEAFQILYKAGMLLAEHYHTASAGNCLRAGLHLSRTTGNSEKEVEFHIALTDLFYRNMQIDSARFYNDEAYKLSQKEDFEKFNSQIFNDKARIAELSGNRLQAIDWYLKDVEIFKLTKDTASLAVILNNIAILHSNMESYDLAIGYLLESIKLKEQLADENALCDSYINLAISYQENNNLTQAVNYYHKAIKLVKKTELPLQ